MDTTANTPDPLTDSGALDSFLQNLDPNLAGRRSFTAPSSQSPRNGLRFTYSSSGELSPGSFSPEEIRCYLYNNPRKSALTLRLQKTPPNAESYCENPDSALCRFSCCTKKDRIIQAGEYRVAFRDTPDPAPFRYAGVVHLMCLEAYLEFPRICNGFQVWVENQAAPAENGAFNLFGLPHSSFLFAARFVFNQRRTSFKGRHAEPPLPNAPNEKFLDHQLSMFELRERYRLPGAQFPSKDSSLTVAKVSPKELTISTSSRDGNATKSSDSALESPTIRQARTQPHTASLETAPPPTGLSDLSTLTIAGTPTKRPRKTTFITLATSSAESSVSLLPVASSRPHKKIHSHAKKSTAPTRPPVAARRPAVSKPSGRRTARRSTIQKAKPQYCEASDSDDSSDHSDAEFEEGPVRKRARR